MRSFIDFSTFENGNKKVEEKCFNNENYDCFSYFEENIKKEADEKIVDITLERIVSRVAFRSTTEMPENVAINDITLSKFDFFGTHTVKDGSINNGQYAGNSQLNLSPFKLENLTTADTKELFFFYTFASPKTGNDVSLHEFNFTINYNNGSTYEYSIPQNTIKPTPNYKILVTGPFLSAPQPVLGNLILNIPSLDTESWKGETTVKLEEE